MKYFFFLVLLFCNKKEVSEVEKVKPEFSVLAISGVQIQSLTIGFDLEYFKKGKVLTYLEDNSIIQIYLIRDFDVLYKFPVLKINCETELKVKAVSFDLEKNLTIIYSCKKNKETITEKKVYKYLKNKFSDW